MKKEGIFKPKPFKEFRHKKVIYIPVDSPSLTIRKAIIKSTLKEKKTPAAHLFLLENKVVLYQCIGAPTAVLSLERLIASGAREIIILSFCGALTTDAKISDAVSITKTFSDEGTSKHYFLRRKVFYPSPVLRASLENTLHTMNLPFINGAIVSTDAPYRETQSWLNQKQKHGIDFVDMEVSAVFALAEYYGIHAAALMLVSDKLTKSRHMNGFSYPRLKENIKKYFLPFIT